MGVWQQWRGTGERRVKRERVRVAAARIFAEGAGSPEGPGCCGYRRCQSAGGLAIPHLCQLPGLIKTRLKRIQYPLG
jgi:hypothetical protein